MSKKAKKFNNVKRVSKEGLKEIKAMRKDAEKVLDALTKFEAFLANGEFTLNQFNKVYEKTADALCEHGSTSDYALHDTFLNDSMFEAFEADEQGYDSRIGPDNDNDDDSFGL